MTAIFPQAFARTFYSTSLLSNHNILDIIKFSNSNIYEIGCGSGFNAIMLQQNGARIYCNDCSNNSFHITFFDVKDSINEGDMKEIIKNDGALLYIWPVKKYHNLDLWHFLGGKKVITIADYRQGWDDRGNLQGSLVCPIFDDKRYELIKTLDVPYFSSEQEDKLRLFVLKN